MSSPVKPVLEMHGVVKRFGRVEVLHGVDFRLDQGSVHALIGHNGAGKSTLIKVLAGMYADAAGEIVLDGEPVRLDSPAASMAAGIAVIQQEFSLVPTFDAPTNIALGLEPKLIPGLIDRKTLRKRGIEALERLGFDVPVNGPVGKLSVAHQQMVEIAKALSKNARLLVMDEPTARLAPPERATLFAAMRRLADSGVGIIYISHFLDEVLQVSDQVTVLRDGSVVMEGPTEGLTVQDLSGHIIGESHNEVSAARNRGQVGKPRLTLVDFGSAEMAGSSIEVRAGEILGIAGLVGSGRSELLEAIAGARPSRGLIGLNQADARPGFKDPNRAMRAGIILVPEDRKQRGLVLDRSIGENIVLSALARFLSRWGFVQARNRQRHIDGAVKRFHIIAANLKEAVSTLSGGNQQKVLFARADGARPKVLLLDQPTAGVDIGAKGELYRIIDDATRDGAACLVASDELEELLALSDRIAVLHAGRGIVEVRPVEDFDERSLLEAMSSTTLASAEVTHD